MICWPKLALVGLCGQRSQLVGVVVHGVVLAGLLGFMINVLDVKAARSTGFKRWRAVFLSSLCQKKRPQPRRGRGGVGISSLAAGVGGLRC